MQKRDNTLPVPFFRPDLQQAEIDEVVETLRSGWLTTGPRTRRFEEEFAAAVGATHALALNSCTAALHLALAALDLQPGQAVLVPTMTFAATAEVVRYLGAVPILVDCDPVTLNLDLEDAEAKLRPENWPPEIDRDLKPVGLIPVHVGGLMLAMDAVHAFARHHGLWVVEDAAHAFPAAWRRNSDAPWQRCGEGTSAVTCFSFYANKTITTGEGGMAVTEDEALLERMRCLSLHGLSKDAWGRYTAQGSWDYRIVAAGFKYNLTDIAAAIGLHQLARAEAMRQDRQRLALAYREALAALAAEGFLELPPVPADRVHAWHLFPIRLGLERLTLDRDAFLQELRKREIGYSVHWRPLHRHPYYEEAFGWRPEHLPNASAVWPRLVTLPLYPTMTEAEMAAVVRGVGEVCGQHRK